MSDWIDITRPIDETLPAWPGRLPPQSRWEKSLAAGDVCNASRWDLSAHSGTHMDAPLHFIAGGTSIDQIPPEVFIGDCQVVDLVASQSSVLDQKLAQRCAGAKRLLIKSGHSAMRRANFEPHDALLTLDACATLLDAGLLLIGTDRLTVDDSRGERCDLHYKLLGAGCVIVEGLCLSEIAAGPYFLSATPLRLADAEASPIRAFLRRAS